MSGFWLGWELGLRVVVKVGVRVKTIVCIKIGDEGRLMGIDLD